MFVSCLALAAFVAVPAADAAVLAPAGAPRIATNRGTGWRLPRATAAVHAPLLPLYRGTTKGLHVTGPGLAAINAAPPGTTVPASLDAFRLTYHGGPVQTTTEAFTVYWDPQGTMDANYLPLIDRYLTDSGGSAIYRTLTQYGGSNGTVTANATFGGSIVDLDPIPQPVTETVLFGELERLFAQYAFVPDLSREVFLMMPHGAMPANGFCAYHGAFSYQGGTAIVGIVPYPDVPMCGEAYDFQSPNADLIADGGVAEVSAAQAGMITDPQLDGWYDPRHGEVEDVCFDDYGDGINSLGADLIVTGAGGAVDSYEVPSVYSNAARGCAPAL